MCSPSPVKERLSKLPHDRVAWIARQAADQAGRAAEDGEDAKAGYLSSLVGMALSELDERLQLQAIKDILADARALEALDKVI